MPDTAPPPSRDYTPTERVHSVFARVRAADLSVADLFNDEAEVRVGNKTWRGRNAIRDYYKAKFVDTPHPQILATLTGGPLVATVLNVTAPDGRSASAVDVFEVDEEGIVSMTVYTAGT